MNAPLPIAIGKPPVPQIDPARIRYEAFTRTALPAFPPRESNRVRIASRGGRALFLDAKS